MKRFSSDNILATVVFAVMLVVNGLANALPIGGVTTGEVSDSLPNLFAPSGITFSIWGVIYLLLGGYTLYQLGLFGNSKNKNTKELIKKVNTYFIISSVANALWIISWHNGFFASTLALMLVILISLVKIADILNKNKLSLNQKLFIKTPFGVYFGWITVATIANITAYLVSIGWDGFGISDQTWTILILVVGAAIATWRTLKDKNIAYGLVPVWAYFGIWLKHTSEQGFGGMYQGIITTLLLLIPLFIAADLYLIVKKAS